ncbi:MAG: response regulator, partial [Planctomycetota bacterium]
TSDTPSSEPVAMVDPTQADEQASTAPGQAAPAVAKTEPASDEPPLTGVRVLIVEDGVDNQRLIGYHLRKAGAETETADHGRLALERLTDGEGIEGRLLEPFPFDVILTDMQMPEMDGYELAGRLRTLACPVPVVALTAHAMESDRDKCLAAGCVDYVTKPIDRDRLIEVCATLSQPPQDRAAA